MIHRQDGSFHQSKHFYWNVHWNANFTITAVANGAIATVSVVPLSDLNVMNFGPVIDGAVTDGRFASLITAPMVTTCNIVANLEVSNQIVNEGVRH